MGGGAVSQVFSYEDSDASVSIVAVDVLEVVAFEFSSCVVSVGVAPVGFGDEYSCWVQAGYFLKE